MVRVKDGVRKCSLGRVRVCHWGYRDTGLWEVFDLGIEGVNLWAQTLK